MVDSEKNDRTSQSDTIDNAGQLHESSSREKADSSESSWPEFHEEGLQAWATVLGGWLMMFSTFGYTNSFGVYQDFYVREYLSNFSSSTISWIGSTQVLLLLSIGLLTGRAFDKGYFYHLIISGTVLFAVCLFMLSLAQPHQYYQIFLSQGLGLGIAMGLTYIPTMAVLAHHFQRRRTLAMGIVVSGASFGGIVHPIMLNKLFHGTAGFALGVRASAGVNLGLMSIALLLMRTRLSPRPGQSLRPAIRRFARDPPYVLAVCGATLVIMSLYFPIFFLQLYSIKHGVNENVSFYTIAVLNGSNAIGRIVPNWAARYVGVYKTMVPATIICGGIIFVLLATHDAAGVMIFAIFYGFFSAVYISLLVPMLVLLSDNLSEIGVRMGVCFTFTGIGTFIGTPIAGAFLTSKFIWWRPTVFAGVVLIVGALLLGFSGMLLAKKRRVVNNTLDVTE